MSSPHLKPKKRLKKYMEQKKFSDAHKKNVQYFVIMCLNRETKKTTKLINYKYVTHKYRTEIIKKC